MTEWEREKRNRERDRGRKNRERRRRGDGRASLFHLAVSTPYSSEWLVLPPPAFNLVTVAASRIKSIDLSFFLWPVRLTSREGWIYPNCLPCLYIHHPSSAPRAAATSAALSSDVGRTSSLFLSRHTVVFLPLQHPFFLIPPILLKI